MNTWHGQFEKKLEPKNVNIFGKFRVPNSEILTFLEILRFHIFLKKCHSFLPSIRTVPGGPHLQNTLSQGPFERLGGAELIVSPDVKRILGMINLKKKSRRKMSKFSGTRFWNLLNFLEILRFHIFSKMP